MFPSYEENPQDYHFEGQDINEKILLLLRAHPIINLSWLIPAILLSLFPLFLPTIISLIGINLTLLPVSFKMIFIILNYLLVSAIVFEGFLNWYFNVFIITDRNVIDVDFHSILFKNIDIAPLRNVEDTSSQTAGVFGSLFHFGDVYIQTAGSSKSIEFHNVPTPHRVADFVLDRTHHIHQGGAPHANHP